MARCSNRVHDFRPGVTCHDDGWYVPGKRPAQDVDGVDTVHRSPKIVVTYQEVGTELLLLDLSQRIVSGCHRDRLHAFRFQQTT